MPTEVLWKKRVTGGGRKKGPSYRVLVSGWDPLRKLRGAQAGRTPRDRRFPEAAREFSEDGPRERNADLAPRSCLSQGTRVFPPGSEPRAGVTRGGRDPVRVGRAGGKGQAGGWQAYRLLLLDPRHGAAVAEPGSRAQRSGWRQWLPGSREGGIKRLLRHVALPLTGPLLLLLLPPYSSPPLRLRQQRPAPGTRQPPGRGSPRALPAQVPGKPDTRSALGPGSILHLSPHFTSYEKPWDPIVY